ncbi:hypothetical protein CL645_04045 [bacterium]|nr:hypothetical protein [bacterium]
MKLLAQSVSSLWIWLIGKKKDSNLRKFFKKNPLSWLVVVGLFFLLEPLINLLWWILMIIFTLISGAL